MEGVAKSEQDKILQEFNIVKGELPFKYLRVPLSTKKISLSQCQGLLNKILTRINCWSANLLSYAGRVQLIKFVLFGIQSYWSQIFILPKKVMKAIKQQDLTTMNVPTQASWIVRKIFAARDSITQTKTGVQLLQQTSFSIHQLYCELRGPREKVEWNKLICCNDAPPKNIFICWLAMMGRLTTCDYLLKLQIQVDPRCSLCKREDETMSHIFFQCDFSTDIWRKLTTWCSHPRQANEWEEKMRYVITQARTKNYTQRMYRLVFTVSIYYIWQERNRRKFQGKEMESDQVVRKAQIHIATTCQGNKGFLKLIKA